MITSRFLPPAIAGLLTAACAGQGAPPVSITTVAPVHCYYDSNRATTACSRSIARHGNAPLEARAYTAAADPMKSLPAFVSGLGNLGKSSPGAGYRFGYDARFEGGYRYPRRFDTFTYEGTERVGPPSANHPPR